MFELIALIAEALFSWPIVPTDCSNGDRRLVNLAYCGLVGALVVLGLIKLA